MIYESRRMTINARPDARRRVMINRDEMRGTPECA